MLRDVEDRKSTRLNSSHVAISYAVFCLKKKKAREHRLVAVAGSGEGLRVGGRGRRPRPQACWGTGRVGRCGRAGLPGKSFFFNDTATPEIYTLSLHDALPI